MASPPHPSFAHAERVLHPPLSVYGGLVSVLRIRIRTYVFGPPGSGSFYHQAKIVRKTLIRPTVLLLLFDFLSLKNYVNVPVKSNKKKTLK